MAARLNVLDSRQVSRPAKYLRDHRFRLTLWIAAVEGLLSVLHVIPSYVIYIVAVVAIIFWASAARRYRSATARNVSWIFAASQACAVLVPIALFFVKWLAIGAVAVIAVVALVILFAERERS
jgi:hypothetical protein